MHVMTTANNSCSMSAYKASVSVKDVEAKAVGNCTLLVLKQL